VDRDDLTRIRVAQAARVPVTAAMVAAQLAPDEAAHSWNADAVHLALSDLVDEGLLEVLPGEPKRFVQRALFEGDAGRRIVAQTAIPRNVEEIRAELRGDRSVGDLPGEYISQVLERAADAGLVVLLGSFEEPQAQGESEDEAQARNAAALADAARGHEETVALQAQQTQWLASRLSHSSRAWRLAGEQWMLTNFGKLALQVIH
jgi:hypothetical protein